MEATISRASIRPIYQLLRIVFTLVPIVAGLDKFTNLLVQWDQYLAPDMVSMLPFSAASFMMIVGVIEVVAGILVWIKPHLGGHIVALWLTLIALTLIFQMKYLDVAVRDLVMAISAFSMTRLAKFAS